MQRSLKLWVSTATVCVASTIFARAEASGFDHVALQGLAPPTIGAPSDSAEIAAEPPQGPRLKLPRRGTGRAHDVLELMSGNADEAFLYSGVRTGQRLGFEYSQAVGGLRYPLSGSWTSTLEASVDTTSPMPLRGYAVLGQVQRTLSAGWGDLSLGLRYNVYELGAAQLHGAADPSNLLSQGLLLHPAVTGASTATTGYELRLNYRYGERNTLGLTYGSGRNFDATQQMLGLFPGDGRQFGLTGQHWLTPDWALSYGLMAQEQLGPHRGQGLHFGLRYRF